MKNRNLTIAILLLGLLAIFAGIQVPAYGLETTEIHGVVTNADGIPVPGADVLVFDSKNVRRPADFSSTRTGSDGLYRVKVPPGKYWMVAVYRANGALFGPLGSDDKHSGDPLPVNAEIGTPLKVDFTVRNLREAARMYRKQNSDLLTFSGDVLDEHGHPRSLVYVVADVKISVGEMPAYISAWTDEEGHFSLYLPPGEYQLGVANTFPPQNFLAPFTTVKVEKSGNNFEIHLPGQ